MGIDAYKKCVLMLIKKVSPEIQIKWVIIFVITLLIIHKNVRLIELTVIKLL